MKDIEVYPSIKKQIFQILLSLGLNHDIIYIIYKINIDDDMKENLYYHKNNLIYKTLDMNIFDTFFKTYSDEYIYHTYFKFTIPIGLFPLATIRLVIECLFMSTIAVGINKFSLTVIGLLFIMLVAFC